MSLHVGIVGLPNVGKSTLFSAITKSAVDCANFPFCTIEPNVGVVAVPDDRLDALATISKSEKVIPTTIEFVDIAGLVAGASKGEGLGNKFLAHIRECDAIAQVVRAFQNPDVIHVDGTIDPIRDVETIGIELVLADLEIVIKRQQSVERELKAGRTKELDALSELLIRTREELEAGRPVRAMNLSPEELMMLKPLQLITMKPMIFVVNVSEEQLSDNSWEPLVQTLQHTGVTIVPVSVKLEAELASMSPEESMEYLESIGQKESGLARLIRAAYESLELITFLTTGPKETRAWTVQRGSSAPVAAGKIHSDFEKHFIRVEVCRTEDFIEFGGEQACKEKGKRRVEGKTYEVQDGDICHFRVDA